MIFKNNGAFSNLELTNVEIVKTKPEMETLYDPHPPLS